MGYVQLENQGNYLMCIISLKFQRLSKNSPVHTKKKSIICKVQVGLTWDSNGKCSGSLVG